MVGCNIGASGGGSDSAQDEGSDSYVEGEGGSRGLNRVWVSDMTRLHVLQRLAEQEPENMFVLGSKEDPFREWGSQVWVTNIDYLLGSGVLEESEDGYSVDTSTSVEEASFDMPDSHDSGVREALRVTTVDSYVEWCGKGALSADEFGREYVEEFYGAHDSQAEYEKSIESYLACEGG